MLDRIIKVLEEEKLDTYLLSQRVTERAELYYIKRNLDVRRLVKTKTAELTLYADVEKNGKLMRGFSSVVLSPEMDEDRIRKEIREAKHSASFALNPFFHLVKGSHEEKLLKENGLSRMSLTEMADAFSQAVFLADTRSDAFLNSLEVFCSKEEVTIKNSEGVDVSYERATVEGEFVVQCKEPVDVELYKSFSYEDADMEALTAFTKEALDTVLLRAGAKDAPLGGSYDLLVSGEEMRNLFSLFQYKTSVQALYPGYSDWKVGTVVQKEDIEGERINMTLHAIRPYSGEGIPMKDLKVMEDGKVAGIHGPARLSEYMGVTATGGYDSMIVSNGSVDMETLKEKPYIHVLNYSDFDMDPDTGHFCGEIRLACLFDGEKTTYVTGGSVSGNLLKRKDSLLFSKERYKSAAYDGPYMVRIPSVSIAGR